LGQNTCPLTCAKRVRTQYSEAPERGPGSGAFAWRSASVCTRAPLRELAGDPGGRGDKVPASRGLRLGAAEDIGLFLCDGQDVM
jgi:hypothetical protein